MKTRNQVLVTLFLFATAPFTLAQHGGGMHFPSAGHASDSLTADSQRMLLLRASEDQRMAFAKCVQANARVRKVVDKMTGPGTRWRYDARVFPGQNEELQIAVKDMTAAHEQFRQALTEAQEKELRKHFDKLEQLQVGMNSQMARLDDELTVREPDSRRIYSEAHKVKETADKWQSEHKKIAKAMSIKG
jgi:hypothetical protein